jgi:DNA-binding transcriptional LysR family regulator
MRYFVAVAEELHFSRAAARLHIAQPPLSQQIKQLESELQTPLLVRTKRHVELTEAGRAFLDEARKTLTQADHAARVARLTGDSTARPVHVGFIDSALYRFVPRMLHAAREAFPAIRIVLHEMTSGQQVDALARSEIQLAILRRTRGGPQILFREIGRERMVVAMPMGHRLDTFDEVPVTELANEDWVLFQRALSPGLHDFIYGICRRAGFAPQVVQEANEGHTIVGLVAAGVGVSIVPDSLSHWVGPEVAYRPISPPAALPMCIATRRGDHSPQLQALVGFFTSRSDWSAGKDVAQSNASRRREQTVDDAS